MARKRTQSRLNTSLLQAEALARTNQLIEAEIRYKDALRNAEKRHGEFSDQVMLVSTILAAFYRAQDRIQEAQEIEMRLATWPLQQEEEPDEEDAGPPVESRFVKGGAAGPGTGPPPMSGDSGVKIPANLRRVCQILGLSMNSPITAADVNKAWKKQMLSGSAHPDLGGNTDEAVLLNQAKEELIRFLEDRQPKLKIGKKNP